MKASKKTTALSSPAAVQKDVYNLPSHNALAQILSDHHTLLTKEKREPQTTAKHKEQNDRTKTQHGIKPNTNHTYQLLHPHKRCPLCVCECAPCLVGFTDRQTEELENHRSGMSRMAEDMIALRTQVMALETENVQLRAHVSLHKDVGRGLLEDTDVDVMTKAEMADRIATLRFKLANETNKTTSQRDRIQQLQNELIRKNELLKLPKDQRSVLAKIPPLEETVKQEEKLINKMKKEPSPEIKKLLHHKIDDGDHRKWKMDCVLTTENAGFDWIGTHASIPKQTEKGVIFPEEKERTQQQENVIVREKLKAENAIITQGKPKQELLTDGSKKKHGLFRTSTTILHNGPGVAS